MTKYIVLSFSWTYEKHLMSSLIPFFLYKNFSDRESLVNTRDWFVNYLKDQNKKSTSMVMYRREMKNNFIVFPSHKIIV
jgi:hypothetical protein